MESSNAVTSSTSLAAAQTAVSSPPHKCSSPLYPKCHQFRVVIILFTKIGRFWLATKVVCVLDFSRAQKTSRWLLISRALLTLIKGTACRYDASLVFWRLAQAPRREGSGEHSSHLQIDCGDIDSYIGSHSSSLIPNRGALLWHFGESTNEAIAHGVIKYLPRKGKRSSSHTPRKAQETCVTDNICILFLSSRKRQVQRPFPRLRRLRLLLS